MTIHIQEIPLSKLVASTANVRRTGTTVRLGELAASIQAHGLLQNLTVKPADKGRFEVIAGGRRLGALKLLAKQKVWAKDAPIPCHVIEEGENVTELSLAENVGQEPMHPADQYEAFAALAADGMVTDDIAARFGVSPQIVTQRLKLSAVSPKLIALYRDGQMNLEQLSAFCITDDHERQEEVWEGFGYSPDRADILAALGEGQIIADEKLAKFIGEEAYVGAGGAIARDLFDEGNGGIYTDTALVMRLVNEKLEAEAVLVRAEGWKWVEVALQVDYSMTSHMRRVYPTPQELNADDTAKLEQLEAEYEALCEDEEAEPAQLGELDAKIDALRCESFTADDLAIAGAFVAIDRSGDLQVERGLVRPEDAPKRERSAGETTQPKAKREDGLSDALLSDLTAHRTAAIQNELAAHPELALTVTVYTLAANVFLRWHRSSCLGLDVTTRALDRYADGMPDSRAGQAIAARDNMWSAKLPGEADALWSTIRAMTIPEQLELLACCVARGVNLVEAKFDGVGEEQKAFGRTLMEALGVKMRDYWQPSAANYLSRVSRAHILAAVREAVSPDAANDISKLGKSDMVKRAEKLLEGTGWLPEVLR